MDDFQKLVIQNSRDHLIDFCLTYDKHYTVNWHHREIANALEEVEKGEVNLLIIEMPPRHGKLLTDSTPILTKKGWKTHGDLVIGDCVFSPSGESVKVEAISKSDSADMEVEFSNGEVIKCHKKHEWVVYDRSTDSERVLETEQLLNNKFYSGGRSRFQLNNIKAVEFNEVEQPLDPYFFGAWLGDGTSTKPAITSEVKDKALIDRIPYEVIGTYVHKDTGVPTYYYSHQNIIQTIRGLGCYNNKHIPDIYKYASRGQRLDLLAGLIDTDGSTDKNSRVRIVTVSKKLAKDIEELVRGLGMRPYIIEQKPTLSTSGIQGKRVVYSIGFQPTMKIPVALKRKRIKRIVKQDRIGIVDIRESKKKEVGRCIQVEGGEYLAGTMLVPTHNSTLASIYFPAWFLGRNPDKEIITASYSGDLAQDFGAKTRDVVGSNQYKAIFETKLKKDTQAKDKWKTTKGGSYTSVGRGGATTGRGANCLIIDDILKDREEAESMTIREKCWNWYTSVAYTRLEKDGAVIIIMTRWHIDDLVGGVIAKAESMGKKYKRIRYPAVSVDDEEHRKEGEALWIDKYDIDRLDDIKNVVGPYDWHALYQQNPIATELQEFKREWFRYYDDKDLEGKDLYYYGLVDLAIGKTETADDTANILIAKEKNRPEIYIIDIYSGHLDPGETIDYWFAMNAKYGSKFVKVGIESVAYQKALSYFIIQEQKKKGIYFDVVELKASSKKELRIRGLIPMYRAGVIHHRPTYNKLEDQLLTFPGCIHDDQIDALAYLPQILDKEGRRGHKVYKRKQF